MNDPVHITLPQTTIIAARKAIDTAKDYVAQALAEHEMALGRTTLKNRLWAEQMETDIKQMDEVLKLLPAPLIYS